MMGETSVDIRYLQDLTMARQTVKWKGHHIAAVAAVDLPAGPNRGRGVAIGCWVNFGGTSACDICLGVDGALEVVTGSVDLTSTRVAMAQIAAEELGMDVSLVQSRVGDTQSVGFTE